MTYVQDSRVSEFGTTEVDYMFQNALNVTFFLFFVQKETAIQHALWDSRGRNLLQGETKRKKKEC